MQENNKVFRNEEYPVLITASKEKFSYIYQYCNESYPNETGGILIGRYKEENVAEIIKITGPTSDSKKDRANFFRGTKGINKLLKELWKEGLYYLGEWHFHPNGVFVPSRIDVQTMKSIANNSKYNCPEPILILVAGSPKNYMEQAYLFLEEGSFFSLK